MSEKPSRAEYFRERHHKRRRAIIEHYGGRCECCGEDTYEFLAIDHRDGGGAKHRAAMKSGGSGIIDWIHRHNFPTGFRILCHSCNGAMGYYGYCPHERG